MQALVRIGLTTTALVVGLLTGALQAAPAASVPASAQPEITVHGADLPPTATPAQVGKDGLQTVPALTAPVIDQTGTLSAAEVAGLTDKLLRFERERGTQMAVLVVATTHPEDIAAYAHRVADQWKIGRRDVGDGLLLVVAKNDRTVRIEVARALEGAVPDLAAYRIIDGVIVPAFRAGDFAGGLDQAVDHLQARVRGENLPLPEAGASRQGEPVDLNMLVVLGLFVVPFVSGVLRALLGKTLGTLATGGVGGALVWLVTGSLLLGLAGVVLAMMLGVAFSSGRGSRGGWPGGGLGGGGWSGGGGGGGWSSGGGGSFGGGGASGRW